MTTGILRKEEYIVTWEKPWFMLVDIDYRDNTMKIISSGFEFIGKIEGKELFFSRVEAITRWVGHGGVCCRNSSGCCR